MFISEASDLGSDIWGAIEDVGNELESAEAANPAIEDEYDDNDHEASVLYSQKDSI